MTATLPTRRCTWRIFPTKLYPRISAKCSPSMDPWVTSIFPWITTPSGPEDSLTFSSRIQGTLRMLWRAVTGNAYLATLWKCSLPKVTGKVPGKWGVKIPYLRENATEEDEIQGAAAEVEAATEGGVILGVIATGTAIEMAEAAAVEDEETTGGADLVHARNPSRNLQKGRLTTATNLDLQLPTINWHMSFYWLADWLISIKS